jgi:hypothetical protein
LGANGGIKFLTLGGALTAINANDALSFALPNDSTAHTQTPNDNSTQVATTEYVDTAISNAPFVGTATSNLNMNNNSITNLLSLDSSTVLSLGGTTALGVNIGRTGQTTDLKGNLRINSSSGTAGQVLTSAGSGVPPIWAAGGGGGTELSYFQSPIDRTFIGLSTCNIYNPITITPPSITATYKLSASMVVGLNSVTSLIFFTFGRQTGATISNIFGAATNILDNAVLLQQSRLTLANTLTQVQTETSVDTSVSFEYIYTPATVSQLTFGIVTSLGTSGSNGLRRLSSFNIVQLKG